MISQRSKFDNLVARMEFKLEKFKETIFEKIEKRKQKLVLSKKLENSIKTVHISKPSKISIQIKSRLMTNGDTAYCNTPQPNFSTLPFNQLKASFANNSNNSYKEFKVRRKSLRVNRNSFFNIHKKPKKAFNTNRIIMEVFPK